MPKIQNRDIVGDYLKKIGTKKLLTANEEIELSKTYQEYRQLLKNMPDKAQFFLKEEKQIIQCGCTLNFSAWHAKSNIADDKTAQIVFYGVQSRAKLYEHNLRLVVSVAKKYLNRGLDFADLISEGNIGLNQAINKFDVSMDYRFSTYAYWWIRQAITRAIGQSSRDIRLPIHVYEKLNKVKLAAKQLTIKLKRTPTAKEIALHLGIPLERLFDLLALTAPKVAIDAKLKEEDDTRLIDILIIPDNQESEIIRKSLAEDLAPIMMKLTPNEQDVIVLRYGLSGQEEHTLSEIGRKLKRSRERIRQIEMQAIKKLTKNSCHLRDYL